MSATLSPNALFDVVVVGAGFAGLTMAYRLREAGIEKFAILEEADVPGGVWRDNRYPGCTCDVPSHLYSFEFAPYRDATVRYPQQSEILHYLHQVVDQYDLRRHLRVNSAVRSAIYDDSAGEWTLTTASGEIRTTAVVWGIGQLHRPYIPDDIPGLDDYRGRAFHSADRGAWAATPRLRGDVAVVGTGSSAVQMVPHLARTADMLQVYQRSAAWILPKPDAEFGAVAREILARVPGAHHLNRAALSLAGDQLLAPIMRGGWPARPAEWLARAHLYRHVRDRSLRRKLLPPYAIGEKRILLDDGAFYRALGRPQVTLVNTGITRLTPTGILAGDGIERPAATIVWATGFQAPEFFGGITVRGRGGLDLHQMWSEQGGRPEAWYGLAVPGFPNMYMIAGPHSFTPANSNPSMKDLQARYIVEALRLAADLGNPIEISDVAMASYQAWLDSALARTVWQDGTPSWFKRAGVVTNPWPDTVGAFGRHLAEHPPHQSFTSSAAATAPGPRIRI
ncbi:4-hydroxyacetophenone monooxygenase [Nocardia otitidiscaviarum]|uniref:4-hydroxyacetophenone monooxygenase n=1 Tax=Nocardia otitidiscaviarum TaxID=1823 RepID=A0A379JM41_9NOCA|nr:NAD(P)/FAD-dependent oxidoreductase [Nocardia otitidiscaviarum]SUD49568.1 4-hydroxyacetophenone monooxygenase [Nocardia otitidiscaviarum]